MNDNERRLRRLIEEVINEGNLDVADELLAEDYVEHSNTGPEPIEGPEGFKGYIAAYRAAFPDLELTIEDVLTDGDDIAYRYTARGTHEGELLGIEATGTRVEVPVVAIGRFENGRAAELWMNADMLGLMGQLGVVPSPETLTGEIGEGAA